MFVGNCGVIVVAYLLRLLWFFRFDFVLGFNLIVLFAGFVGLVLLLDIVMVVFVVKRFVWVLGFAWGDELCNFVV